MKCYLDFASYAGVPPETYLDPIFQTYVKQVMDLPKDRFRCTPYDYELRLMQALNHPGGPIRSLAAYVASSMYEVLCKEGDDKWVIGGVDDG